MKYYFYGSTLEAAEKKCKVFVKKVNQASDRMIKKTINVTQINGPGDADPHCVVSAYKYCVCCQYYFMAAK